MRGMAIDRGMSEIDRHGQTISQNGRANRTFQRNLEGRGCSVDPRRDEEEVERLWCNLLPKNVLASQ